MGFCQVKCEQSVWIWKQGDDRIIILVFVDDITIACKRKAAIARVIADLSKHFQLCVLGPTSFLLGVHIDRDQANRTLTLSQKQYMLDILQHFEMDKCSPVSTLIDPSIKYSKSMAPQSPEDVAYVKDKSYLSAVGALQYLSVVTFPQIAYAVGVFTRFSSNPEPMHWKGVKHLLRYVKGHVDTKLIYSPLPPGDPLSHEMFITYSDADYAGNPNNGRSTTVNMGTGAVGWTSHLQTVVTLSTTEAEYVAACAAGTEILFLSRSLNQSSWTCRSKEIWEDDGTLTTTMTRFASSGGDVRINSLGVSIL